MVCGVQILSPLAKENVESANPRRKAVGVSKAAGQVLSGLMLTNLVISSLMQTFLHSEDQVVLHKQYLDVSICPSDPQTHTGCFLRQDLKENLQQLSLSSTNKKGYNHADILPCQT